MTFSDTVMQPLKPRNSRPSAPSPLYGSRSRRSWFDGSWIIAIA
jgi:hypothetical protein